MFANCCFDFIAMEWTKDFRDQTQSVKWMKSVCMYVNQHSRNLANYNYAFLESTCAEEYYKTLLCSTSSQTIKYN